MKIYINRVIGFKIFISCLHFDWFLSNRNPAINFEKVKIIAIRVIISNLKINLKNIHAFRDIVFKWWPPTFQPIPFPF